MKSVKMFGKSVPLVAIVLACMLTIGASAYLVNYLSSTVTSDVAVMSPFKVGISSGAEHPTWATAQRWRPSYTDGQNVFHPDEPVDAFPEGWVGAFEAPGVYEGLDTGGWVWTDWVTGTATLVMPDIVGGQTIVLYLMSQNLADATIIAHEEIRVSNPDGLTKEDFTYITCTFDAIYGHSGYGKLHTNNLTPDDMKPVLGSGGKCLEFWLPENTSEWGGGEADVSRWYITFNAAAAGTYTFSYRITPRADGG